MEETKIFEDKYKAANDQYGTFTPSVVFFL